MEKLQVIDELLTIQQMAQISGLSAHTLRYYERAGLMERIGRDNSSGHRHYTRQDLDRIEFIKRLRATGMPIRDVQRYTELLRQGDDTVDTRMQLLKQHRQHIEEHLNEVEQHLAAINYKITYYEQKQLQQREGKC
ncbi:MAG TPA: MerR family transcriptional regulator [Ktedonobacteraceae bacterium]